MNPWPDEPEASVSVTTKGIPSTTASDAGDDGTGASTVAVAIGSSDSGGHTQLLSLRPQSSPALTPVIAGL